MTSLFSNRAGDDSVAISAYVKGLTDLTAGEEPLDILARIGGSVRGVIAGLTDAQLRTPEQPGKWSMRDVVRHLADAELVLAFRYRMILAHDRPPIAAYDQDLWVEKLERDDDTETIAGDLEAVRSINLRLLRVQQPEAWQRVGLHAERGEESLALLVRMAAGHDLVHTRQLLRIRAAIE
ncbi:MAG TPA: DinB family protein [Thermoanaerobaculia bacterium]|nr:DinB family protein [Thermoanaerobaculia bacterium]